MDVAMSTISANGQIVIPADIRRRLGLEEGTKFLILEEGGDLVLKPLHPEDVEETFAAVVERLHAAFEAAGLDQDVVEEELADHRADHHAERS